MRLYFQLCKNKLKLNVEKTKLMISANIVLNKKSTMILAIEYEINYLGGSVYVRIRN